MTFKTHFDSYVMEGDCINCTVDGIDFTARLEFDHDTNVNDADCYSKKAIEAWRNDEWHFFGVVISATKNDVELSDHLASLWGIEGNFPSRRKNPNRYFRDVANELLPDAIKAAKERLEEMREKLA